MYTVFAEDGQPKIGWLGMVVFVRTLEQARRACEPGERIVHWSSGGSPKTTWECGPDGKCRVVPKAR